MKKNPLKCRERERENKKNEKGREKWGRGSRKGGKFGRKVEERGIIGREKRGPKYSSALLETLGSSSSFNSCCP